MTARKAGPLAGILFVVLAVVAFIVGGESPGADDKVAKVVSFYNDNDSEQMVAGLLLGLACVALLFFLGALRRRLREAAGDEGGLSTVTLVGGVILVVGATIFAGLTFTLGDAVDHLPDDAVMALNAMNSDMFISVAVGVATFNLGLGLSILRHGGLPRALGWVAVVVGVAGMTPAGFFAFLATGLVIVAVSVIMLISDERDDRPASSYAGMEGLES